MTDDQNDGTTDGGALRAQLEKALKDLKSQSDANAELAKQVRGSSVKELFNELKVDTRGAKFYAGEPTKEALTEWLKGDGEIFANAPAPVAPGTAAPVVPGVVPTALPPGVTPEILAAAQAVAGLVPVTPPAPTGDLGALTDKLGTLQPNQAEFGTALTDTWSAIRAQAAAQIAAGIR